MGRLPTPTALKDIRGTRRRDRETGVEPTPPTMELGVRPPAWVRDARARRAWRYLQALLIAQKLLSDLDAMSLALLVDAFGEEFLQFVEGFGDRLVEQGAGGLDQ